MFVSRVSVSIWSLALLLVSSAGCGDDDGTMLDVGIDAAADIGVDVGFDTAPEDAGYDTACHTPIDGGPVITPDAGPIVAPPVIDCGTPTFPAGTTLRRWPYLQSVTPTSARIAWTTTTGTASVVRYRAPGATEWLEAAASVEEFTTARTEDTEDYIAFDAELTGLEPSAVYCYEVVSDDVVVASGLGLRTGWTTADSERSLRIVAMGDSGSGSDEQRELAALFMDTDYDLFLHLGDMAYGSGTFPEFEANMFGVYQSMLHRVPSWPTIGNHEDKTDRATPYLDVYYLPEHALRDSDQERYYSFDYGDVHFVSIDSNDGTLIPIALDIRDRVDDDMLDWLEQDLASSDATWKIAFFHHPPYSSSSRGANLGVRNHVLPILEAGGVDLALSGHDHHYERTFPIREGCLAQRDDSAITYIVAGAGGAGLRGDVVPDWWEVESNDELYSFVELDIHGCIATIRSIAIDGSVIDTFQLNGCE